MRLRVDSDGDLWIHQEYDDVMIEESQLPGFVQILQKHLGSSASPETTQSDSEKVIELLIAGGFVAREKVQQVRELLSNEL